MRMSRGLNLGVILYDNNNFIVDWFSLYNFDEGPIGDPIGIQTFLIQFWYNNTVYIALVSDFELIIYVSDCFLENQSIVVPLERWFA